MTISIDLNEVVRDFMGKLKKTYKKYHDKESIEPIIYENLSEHFPMENENFDEFLYSSDCSLEIFGYSDEVINNAMTHVNTFFSKCRSEGIKLEIVSLELNNSKPATLFFLSKTGCKVNDIRFVNNEYSKWDGVDVLITADPLSLKNKPKDKVSIKVISEYNNDSDGDYVINNIKEVLDNSLLDKIINTKTIDYEEQ